MIILRKDDPMKTRLTSRKTVGDRKLVKRVSLRDSGISIAENFAQKLEECFMNPQRASDDELVCLFFMNRNRDEFDQTINGEVRELIADRV